MEVRPRLWKSRTESCRSRGKGFFSPLEGSARRGSRAQGVSMVGIFVLAVGGHGKVHETKVPF